MREREREREICETGEVGEIYREVERAVMKTRRRRQEAKLLIIDNVNCVINERGWSFDIDCSALNYSAHRHSMTACCSLSSTYLPPTWL